MTPLTFFKDTNQVIQSPGNSFFFFFGFFLLGKQKQKQKTEWRGEPFNSALQPPWAWDLQGSIQVVLGRGGRGGAAHH